VSAMHTPHTTYVVCPVCEGRKEVTEPDGYTHGCGNCDAQGGHWQTVEPPEAAPQADGG
jgi:hypothetical protein